MVKIDAHQHFWTYDSVRDSWIDDAMAVIRRDFFPADLEPILKANGIDGSIVVQSDQSEAENSFQLAHADRHAFIKGVVGWIDLQSSNVEERLSYYQQFKKLKGFRHVLQGETQRDFMLRSSFLNGVSKLDQYGFSYDVLVFTDQLKFTEEFVKKFPNQRFIIDHLSKPAIKEKKLDEWKKDISAIAKHENVYCKISGMVTEADWSNWKEEDFFPYLDVVVEAFGTKRIVFGSDWPVCLVAASYAEMMSIVNHYFTSFSESEKELFFGGNAERFYKL